MATMAYANDNVGLVVPQTAIDGTGWFVALIPYSAENASSSITNWVAANDLRASRNVLHCPQYQVNGLGRTIASYGMKVNLTLADGSWPLLQGNPQPQVPISLVKRITNQIMAGDSVSSYLRADTDYGCLNNSQAYFHHAGPHNGGARESADRMVQEAWASPCRCSRRARTQRLWAREAHATKRACASRV